MRLFKRRTLVLIAVCLAMSLALTACGSASGNGTANSGSSGSNSQQASTSGQGNNGGSNSSNQANNAGSGGSGSSSQNSGSSQAQAKLPKQVIIGFQPIPDAPALARSKGFVKQQMNKIGVKVKWKQFSSGSKMIEGFAAGAVNMGLVGSTGVATAVSQDVPVQVFWIHDIIGKNEALTVRKGTGIKTVKDLKGHTVATPFASTSHYELMQALANAGVKTSQLKLVDMQPPEIAAAFSRGNIDATWVWYPTLQKLLDMGGKEILTSEQMANKGYVTANLGVVNSNFASKYPKVVDAYLKALDQAVKYWRKDPQDSAKAVASLLSSKPKTVLPMMKKRIWLDGKQQLQTKYIGKPGADSGLAKAIVSQAKFLASHKFIDHAASDQKLKASVTGKYLEQTFGQ